MVSVWQGFINDQQKSLLNIGSIYFFSVFLIGQQAVYFTKLLVQQVALGWAIPAMFSLDVTRAGASSTQQTPPPCPSAYLIFFANSFPFNEFSIGSHSLFHYHICQDFLCSKFVQACNIFLLQVHFCIQPLDASGTDEPASRRFDESDHTMCTCKIE